MAFENFKFDLPDGGKYPIKLTEFPKFRIVYSDLPQMQELVETYIQRADYWEPDSLGNQNDNFSEYTLIEETEVTPIQGGLVTWKKVYSNAAYLTSSGQLGEGRISYEVISASYPEFRTSYDLYLSSLGQWFYNGGITEVTQTSKTAIARVRETFYETTNPSGITLQSALKVIPSQLWQYTYQATGSVNNIGLEQVDELFGTENSTDEDALHNFSSPTRDEFLNATYFKPIDDRLERVKGNLWSKKEYLVKAEMPVDNASALV